MRIAGKKKLELKDELEKLTNERDYIAYRSLTDE
jgi:hypothetical protein